MTDPKSRGLLSRADMIQSAGLSESAFNRLRVEPAERHGRQTFYRAGDVVAAILEREALRSKLLQAVHATSPRAAEAAAGAMADEALR